MSNLTLTVNVQPNLKRKPARREELQFLLVVWLSRGETISVSTGSIAVRATCTVTKCNLGFGVDLIQSSFLLPLVDYDCSVDVIRNLLVDYDCRMSSVTLVDYDCRMPSVTITLTLTQAATFLSTLPLIPLPLRPYSGLELLRSLIPHEGETSTSTPTPTLTPILTTRYKNRPTQAPSQRLIQWNQIKCSINSPSLSLSLSLSHHILTEAA